MANDDTKRNAGEDNQKKDLIMKLIAGLVLSALLLSANTQTVMAQECGPNCPICSGSVFSTETMLSTSTILTRVLVFPEGEETFVTGVKLALSPRLDVGVSYLGSSGSVIFTARTLLLQEEDIRPGIVAGIGSVRADASDQSVFLSLTKNLEDALGPPVRISLGVAGYLSGGKRLYPIGTVSYFHKEKLLPFISYDGLNVNYGVSWFMSEKLNIGLMYVENRYLGISTGLRITR